MFDARLLYRIYSCIHFHWHCWTIVGNSRCMVYSEPMHDKWTVANQVAFSLTLQFFIRGSSVALLQTCGLLRINMS